MRFLSSTIMVSRGSPSSTRKLYVSSTPPRKGRASQLIEVTIQDTQAKKELIGQIYDLVSRRPPTACNFLPLPPMLSRGAMSTVELGPSDAPTQVIYRTYATLSFIMIATSTESPLALIDLIQVFVESLDRMFENVCELDLIFGFESMHAVLAEMIIGGVVLETNTEKIVASVRSQEGSAAKRSINTASAGMGRGGLPGLSGWR